MAKLPSDVKLTLLGVLLALFLGALDQTIVSTALPRIVEDLKGLERYAWVATAYLLASTALVPIYGRLADLYSRKRIELAAVGLFLLGSALCGLAGEFGDLPLIGDGMNQLIFFRALQGVGGAGLFAMAFIVIADLFPPAERGRYQGLVGATFGISSVLGPWIGGLLTDYGGSLVSGVEGWRWVFYVNLPFGALALYVIVRHMPKLEPEPSDARFDALAALLLIAGLVPLVLALSLDKTKYAWASATTLGLFTTAAIALSLFSLKTVRAHSPLLDFRLFANRVFATANLALFLLGGAFLSILVFLPLFMVNVLGVSATKAGTSLIPLSLGLVFGAIVSGQVVSRYGHYRRLMLGGGVILFIGCFFLSRMTTETSFLLATAYMVLCGLGLGPSFPLYTLAIQNAVDPQHIGQATSASQFFRQIGGTVGAAVMGTVLATSLSASFAAFQQEAGQGAPSMAAPAGGEGATSGGLDEIEAQIRARFEIAKQRAPNEEARAAIAAQEEQVVADALSKVRNAFADAVTTIFFYALFLIVAAWIVTMFIPELPLRRTMGPPPMAE